MCVLNYARLFGEEDSFAECGSSSSMLWPQSMVELLTGQRNSLSTKKCTENVPRRKKRVGGHRSRTVLNMNDLGRETDSSNGIRLDVRFALCIMKNVPKNCFFCTHFFLKFRYFQTETVQECQKIQFFRGWGWEGKDLKFWACSPPAPLLPLPLGRPCPPFLRVAKKKILLARPMFPEQSGSQFSICVFLAR